ncbi:unnamed protein product [Mytilus edulis]|uniref:Endonuclease/exonuclease/phosphatase domain-containing protein n=1 Tax=Mytilus edulis TaxID=6550 RepID=A0A8S3R2E1_MYTED|nr:unnamed protein product [Mytilus edulis]
MWFCVPCRKVVEEHIVTDLKIEARCKEIMANYEQRIQAIELAVDTKCDETRVREIVEESIIKNSCDKDMIREIAKDEATKTGAAVHKKMEEAENKGTGPQKKATVTTVIEEMNERKARENNLIIFGITENKSEVKQERIDHDIENINELFYDAKINLEEGNIVKTKRLGKYDSKKDSRPLLVNLKSIDSKLTLFKNMHYIRGMPKYEKVNVSNDLTQSEREQEKVLWAEAKKLQEQCISGEYQYKLFNKLSELIVRARDNKPNIIGITEVKPKVNRYKPSKAEYSLPEVGNYKMYEKNLETDEGRGLLLYIDSNLESTEVNMEAQFQENIFIKIKLNQNDKLLIGLIYRSPSNNTKEYNDKLTELISEATQKGFSHILIMGDFNYPAIDWEIWNTKGENVNSIENRFLESIQENFLFQHTTKPTRWRGTDTPHTLDLILTNEEEMINNLEYMSPLGKSDHCVLSFDYNCYINIKNKPRIAKLTKIRTNKKMTQIGKKKNAFPVEKKTRELIKRKNILSKKIVTNQDPEIRAEYNRVRNKTKSSVNKLKKKFEKGLSENAKANPKAIWSYVKSKSKTREGIGDLHTDPDDTKSPKTDDDKEKAEILSEYFASVFTQEPDDEIPVPNPINIENELTDLIINKDMIMKHLKKLKIDKSPGPDKLHPRLLRETMESIAEPLSLIFNQSLNEKTVPKEWKNALVSAIFKRKQIASKKLPPSESNISCL